MKSSRHLRIFGAALIVGSLAPALQAAPNTDFSPTREASQTSRPSQEIKIHKVKQRIALHDQSALRTTLSQPGAEYIKVYFSTFSLPEDAYVEITDPSGAEHYRYTNEKIVRDQQGLMPAMSISGQTAIVQIVDPSDSFDPDLHGVIIDGYEIPAQSAASGAPAGAYASYVGNTRIRPACFKENKNDPEQLARYHYSRPVALVNNNNGNGSTGSAWRVGEPIEDENGLRFLMFSNEHVIQTNDNPNRIEIWFDYEHTHCKDRPAYQSAVRKTPFKLGIKKLLHSRSGWDYDYHLFELQVAPKDVAKLKSFGYLGLDIETAERGQKMYIPQHGVDTNVSNPIHKIIKTIASKERDGGACTIFDAYQDRVGGMWHGCQVTPGASGSPIIRSDTHTVVGLHNSLTSPATYKTRVGFAAAIRDIWQDVAPYFDHRVPESYPLPGLIVDKIIAPEPPVVEIITPDPVVEEIVAPEPPVVKIVTPDPVVVEIVPPKPPVVVIATPDPVVVEIVTPETSIPNYKNRDKYVMGAIVLQDGKLYQCKQPSLCGSPSFAPGKALSDRAWNLYQAVSDKTVAPDTAYPDYKIRTRYAMGATVQHDGKLYQCKQPSLCGSPPYAPGKALSHRAWSDYRAMGDKTVAAQPTHPNYKNSIKYVMGATVQHDGKLYQCTQPRLCGSPPYAPGKAMSSRAWSLSDSVKK